MTGNSQGNPANATPVYLGGGTYNNILTSALTQAKVGPGVSYGGFVNAGGGGTGSAAAFYDGASDPVTITIASPGVITWAAHGLAAGAAVAFSTTGGLPTGLTADTLYYVANDVHLTADTFAVSDTKAHALAGTNQINTSVSQSGVQTGWDLSKFMVSVATTAVGNIPFTTNGIEFVNGLIVLTTDGGGAANFTAVYR